MVYRPAVQDLCFVLLPFEPPFLEYYAQVIKPTVLAKGLRVLKADDVFGTKAIATDIWEHVWAAQVVIAEVTGRNPNVNYELGICHTLGVPTILVTQSIADVPFDYRHRRCLVYDTSRVDWADDLRDRLARTLDAVLTHPIDEDLLRWPYDTSPASGSGRLRSGVSAPQALFASGIDRVSELVEVSFGPRGGLVHVESNGITRTLRCGSAIARALTERHPTERAGLRIMQRLSSEISQKVGDGSKTALILAAQTAEEGPFGARPWFRRGRSHRRHQESGRRCEHLHSECGPAGPGPGPCCSRSYRRV